MRRCEGHIVLAYMHCAQGWRGLGRACSLRHPHNHRRYAPALVFGSLCATTVTAQAMVVVRPAGAAPVQLCYREPPRAFCRSPAQNAVLSRRINGYTVPVTHSLSLSSCVCRCRPNQNRLKQCQAAWAKWCNPLSGSRSSPRQNAQAWRISAPNDHPHG